MRTCAWKPTVQFHDTSIHLDDGTKRRDKVTKRLGFAIRQFKGPGGPGPLVERCDSVASRWWLRKRHDLYHQRGTQQITRAVEEGEKVTHVIPAIGVAEEIEHPLLQFGQG